MHQCYVPAELKERIAKMERNAPEHQAEVQSTRTAHQFLSACNNLFEEGLLSHSKIFTVNDNMFGKMESGFTFFVESYDERRSQGIEDHKSSDFISQIHW